MKIAVCDDNIRDLARVKQFLFQMNESDLQCECFVEPPKLLELIQRGTYFDLYILDIEMPEVNGIELAHQIREVDKKALLVFFNQLYQIYGRCV